MDYYIKATCLFIINFLCFMLGLYLVSIIIPLIPAWATSLLTLLCLFSIFAYIQYKYNNLYRMASNARNNSSDCEHRVKTLSAKLDRSRDLILNKISKIGKDTAKLKAKTKLPFIVDFDKTIEALAKKQFQNFDSIAMKSILDKTYAAFIEATGTAKTLLDDTKIHKDYWEITDEGTVYRFNYPIKVEDSESVNPEEVPMLYQGTVIRDEESGEYLATLVSEQTFFDRSSLSSNEPDVAQFKDYNLIRCKRWVEISSGLE